MMTGFQNCIEFLRRTCEPMENGSTYPISPQTRQDRFLCSPTVECDETRPIFDYLKNFFEYPFLNAACIFAVSGEI